MSKGKEPWIGFPDAALTGGFVHIDPAAGTQATAVGPTERLNREAQQDVFAQEPGEIEAIVLKSIYIHLLGGQLNLLAPGGAGRPHIENLKLIRYRDRDRLRASAAQDRGRGLEGSRCQNPSAPALQAERSLNRGQRHPQSLYTVPARLLRQAKIQPLNGDP
jgi:hypothetical protein